ncbi:LigA [Burkholderia sp. IT-111MI5]
MPCPPPWPPPCPPRIRFRKLIARSSTRGLRAAERPGGRQQPQAVGDDDQARARVREYRHPHRAEPRDREAEEHDLHAEREADVLHQYAVRRARQPHERGNLAQVVVHQRDVGRLDRRVGAHRAHRETDVGARERRRVVDPVADHPDRARAAGRQFLDRRELVLGQLVAARVVDAGLLRDGLRGVRVVARQHRGADAERMQVGDRVAARVLDRVGYREDAEHARVVDQHHDALALPLERIELRFEGRRAALEFLDEPVVAEPVARAVDRAAHAAPDQCFEVLHIGERRRSGVARRGRDRLRHRVIRARGEARAEVPDTLGIDVGRMRVEVGLHRLAVRDRAGLVEREPRELAPFLQIDAALHENPAPRRGREPRHDRHRRRDHQCARACDHEQHQRAVDPVVPRAAHHERRHHRDQQRDREHDRRVDARELVDEALRRRLRTLRLLDRVDDPRERRVGRDGRHAVFERTRFVDRACVHGIAGRLFDRQALAGDRRLVDRRAAGNDFAVQPDPLARLHAHDRAERDLRGLDGAPRPVGILHGRGVRRELHQALDRIARAVERLRLDQFGDREQHHHHRGFRPLADRHRARHRDAHQRVDVQVAVANRDPALLVRSEPAREHRRERERRRQPHGQAGPGRPLGRDRGNARQRQRPPRLRGRVGDARRRRAGRCGLGRHPERADRTFDRRLGARHVLDGQHPLHQVEFERRHLAHPAELLADQRLLGRAVHLHDPERGAHVARCGRLRDRQRCERQRGGGAAVAGRVVVVVVVVVTGMVVRRVVVRARRAVCMCVAVRMIVIVIVPLTTAVVVIMVMAARCGVAVRVLAGRRRRVGNGRRVRVARVGAARVGAAGMAVSWVVGTLGVGHDNLLYGLTV